MAVVRVVVLWISSAGLSLAPSLHGLAINVGEDPAGRTRRNQTEEEEIKCSRHLIRSWSYGGEPSTI
jgi:hypothetical protein